MRQKRIFNRNLEKPKRQSLRVNATLAERKLWFYLSDRRLLGYKFRRQVSLGPYIMDFYSYDLELAIEVDGDSHFTKQAQQYDRHRQDYIESFGVKVLRFTNDEVLYNVDEVLAKIIHFIKHQPRPATPSLATPPILP